MKEKQKEIKLVPDVLKALRETSGYSIEEVAKKLKTSPEKIKRVEKGMEFFTTTEIYKLEGLYKYSLAAFFSDSAPKLPVMPDYRINRNRKLTHETYLAERNTYYLSEKIKDLCGKRSQIPSFSDTLKAGELAKEFRKFLNIELIKSKKPEEILTDYKKILEGALSIIIIEYPLNHTNPRKRKQHELFVKPPSEAGNDVNDVRAFSTSSYISVIVLNENDKPSIKLFSLFHEICHLLKRNAGICSIDIEKNDQGIEFYCNQFAAEFLIPSDNLMTEVKKFRQIDEEEINKLTETYGVSKQTMMICLLRLGYIEKETYQAFKNEINEKEIEVVSKQKKFGRRNWDKIYLNRVGNLSLQEVKKAYLAEKITFYESSRILNLKTKYVEKFID
ncbi:MAG: hypothetical protein CVT88_04755 [Candidatus Altiarchaeales archaeon HGW-Altiarchaeales-1]|nr:MAG: hypothetical protein CVT88_04755 [Candidatus Altiarchaeales archaeon HGW-Altiarchaeales-1]